MKVLFAVSNESISESIIKKYESTYKEIISSKNVYYFNAILKELQKDKSYDRVVISEDLEPFTNNNYETTDNFIFEKLDRISDEAVTLSGEDTPIILITADRRTKGDPILNKLFGIGIYSALIGQDRTIQKLCELINKPRSKKEAKAYYKIDPGGVDYKAENEDDVSELEIQNILAHYKKLGKNEEKYVESFNSIANQYTDQQLKVIIKFLPIGVKAVLEAQSPKYQQIAAFSGESVNLKNQKPYNSTQVNPRTNKARSTGQAVVDNGIKIESITNEETKRPSKPVIIPATVSTKNVRKIQKTQAVQPQQEIKKVHEVEEELDFEENINKNEERVEMVNSEEIKEQPKRGRGRPKKVANPAEIRDTEKVVVVSAPKRGRGRPKKIQEQPQQVEANPTEEINSVLDELDDFEIDDNDGSNILPGFDTIDEKETQYVENNTTDNQEESDFLPGFDSTDDDNILTFDEPELPGFDDIEKSLSNNNKNYVPTEQNSNEVNYRGIYQEDESDEEDEDDIFVEQEIKQPQENQIRDYNYQADSGLDALLSSDKKIVAFVGSPKNGTSFLINNIADIFSKQGIKTAILDLTKNKNSYYIYTKNEEDLRKIAIESMNKLAIGSAQGIPVSKSLDVYTALPGESDDVIHQYENILKTLVQNYSLVLLDCDFSTDYGYLREAQEIYLVQSMDVLTIQPLTAYLRDLKAKNVLDQEKLRIVINKYTKVRSVTERTIIGGMAFYNDPSMSYMTELFNRESIRYTVVPFEMQTYSRYLEGLVNCNITINNYSKDFINSLRTLANMVYPLVSNTSLAKTSKFGNSKYNKYASNTFSNDINNTLNKMKSKI